MLPDNLPSDVDNDKSIHLMEIIYRATQKVTCYIICCCSNCHSINHHSLCYSLTGSDYKIIKRPESRRKLKRQDSAKVDNETLSKVDLKADIDKLPASTSAEAVAEAALRLRSLVLRLEKDDLSQADIKNNLKYAANVLDNFDKTADQKR